MPFELDTISIAVLVLIGLIVVFATVFFYFYKLHIYHTRHIVPRTMDWVFLEILMPKENADEKEKQKTDPHNVELNRHLKHKKTTIIFKNQNQIDKIKKEIHLSKRQFLVTENHEEVLNPVRQKLVEISHLLMAIQEGMML